MNGESRDLLNIQLNTTGVLYLKKTFAVGKWLFAFCVAGTVLSLVLYAIRYKYLKQFGDHTNWMFFAERDLLTAMGLIELVVLFAQVFFYFLFVKRCNQSINDGDEAGFNRSFRLFYRNALFALIQFLMNLLFGLFYIYFYWQLLNNNG